MNLQLITENKSHELAEFTSKVLVKLLKFKRKLVPLPPISGESGEYDWMPRCNKVYVTIGNDTQVTIEDLLLTVTRIGSKIGEDNFDTVPIKTYGLHPKTTGKYELTVFDPFNELFEDMEVRIATERDWEERKKVDKWINRAEAFSKRMDKGIFGFLKSL